MTNTRTHKVINAFKWSYLNTIAKVVLQLIVVSILAHLIPPKDFGLLSISFIFVNFADTISQIGIGPAIIQRENLSEDHIKTGFTIVLLMGFFFTLFFILSSSIIANFFKNDSVAKVLKWVSLIYLIRSLGIIPKSLLRRKMKFKELMKIDVISYLIGYGLVGITIAILKQNIWALVFAALTSALISSFLSFVFQPHSVKLSIKFKTFKELFSFGGGYTLLSIFNYIARNGDNFIVGKFLGTKSLGIYSRVYVLISLPATYFASVLDNVLFPAMSEIQNDTSILKKIVLSSVELNTFVSLIISIYIFFLSPDIIYILLGKEWLESVPILKIMSLGVMFRSGYKISDSLIRAKGAVFGGALRHGVYAFLVLLGAYFGTLYGLSYVAFGIVLALFTQYVFTAQLTIKLINLSWKEFLKAHFHPFRLFIVTSSFFYFSLFSINRLNLKILYHFVILSMINLLFLLIILYFFSEFFLGSGLKRMVVKISRNSPYISFLIKKI